MTNYFKSLKNKFCAQKQINGKKRLIIVDDEENICLILKNMLENNPDYEIVGEAHDGDEALELYKLNKPDAIILDIKMPRFDGTIAMQNILAYDPKAKIITLSALNDRKTIVDMIKAGAVNYITKPITPEDLLETLADIFTAEND